MNEFISAKCKQKNHQNIYHTLQSSRFSKNRKKKKRIKISEHYVKTIRAFTNKCIMSMQLFIHTKNDCFFHYDLKLLFLFIDHVISRISAFARSLHTYTYSHLQKESNDGFHTICISSKYKAFEPFVTLLEREQIK